MPKAQSNGNKQAWAPNVVFIRWQMTAEEKRNWKAAHEKDPFGNLDYLDGLLLDEYKMSLSYDNNNDTHICTIMCKPDKKKGANVGLAFSTRGKSATEAMDMALYKHVHLSVDGEWPRDEDGYDQVG